MESNKYILKVLGYLVIGFVMGGAIILTFNPILRKYVASGLGL